MRITSIIIKIYAVILLIKNIILNLYQIEDITNLKELSTFIYNNAFIPLVLIAVSAIIDSISGVIKRSAEEQQEEFNKKLIGLIKSYRKIYLPNLAKKMNIDVNKLEEILAKLKHDGLFTGYIDNNMMVYAEHEEIPPAPVVNVPSLDIPKHEPGSGVTQIAGQTTTIPQSYSNQPTQTSSARPPQSQEAEHAAVEQAPVQESQLDEETRKKLEELKRALEEGLISKEAYEEAVRELMQGRGKQQ